MRFVASALVASTALLTSSTTAGADTCAPARAMIVLDRSSSMVTGFIGQQTKWDVAVAGIGTVLDTYQAKAEFGLMTFPQPNQCGPGRLDVAPAMSNKTSIMSSLDLPPPNAGNWTPMAQTLEVAAVEPSLVNASGAKHVILVTDGWQWCSPYDPNTRFDGVDAVGKLDAAGITTWIVGFGAEVDAAALNQMAVVADTKKPNCNPNSTDPAAPNNCYYQVDNSTDLVQALTAISNQIVAAELCDGLDNDCDGNVDDDLTRDCSTSCGAGTETCKAGQWVGCTAPAPATCDMTDEEDDPTDGPAGEMHAGCGCESNNSGGPSATALFFALAFLALRRRRV